MWSTCVGVSTRYETALSAISLMGWAIEVRAGTAYWPALVPSKEMMATESGTRGPGS